MAEKNYMIKIAETKEELEGYYALRHEVFVDEQKIFTKTDRDKYDEQALPMIAKEKSSGVVIGTVRCYLVAEKHGSVVDLRCVRLIEAGLGCTLFVKQ